MMAKLPKTYISLGCVYYAIVLTFIYQHNLFKH